VDVHILGWIGLAAIILTLIVIDIVGHVRTPHEPTMKEAAVWSVAYIGMALAFGGIVWFVWGGGFAQEYLAGYITEKALSIDNLFVFVIMMSSFKVPRKYQQEVLLAGIVIALILRLIFILAGAALIENFSWVFYFFGALLLRPPPPPRAHAPLSGEPPSAVTGRSWGPPGPACSSTCRAPPPRRGCACPPRRGSATGRLQGPPGVSPPSQAEPPLIRHRDGRPSQGCAPRQEADLCGEVEEAGTDCEPGPGHDDEGHDPCRGPRPVMPCHAPGGHLNENRGRDPYQEQTRIKNSMR